MIGKYSTPTGRFYQRLKDVATYLEEMEADAELPEIRSVDDLLNSIENQKLHQALIMVDKLTLQIVLMRLQGYKFSEIADLLGLSEQTVYKRMQRFKKKIKKNFEIVSKNGRCHGLWDGRQKTLIPFSLCGENGNVP